MSATNRGGARVENDAYRTPPWAVEQILSALARDGLQPPRRILDPGMGTGIIGSCCKLRWPSAELVGIEIGRVPVPSADADCFDTILSTTDYVASADPKVGPAPGAPALYRFSGKPFDLVLMNPPYNQAEAFLRRTFRLPLPKSRPMVVGALLRLGFFESKSRVEFHRQYPCSLYVLSKRPSFVQGLRACPHCGGTGHRGAPNPAGGLDVGAACKPCKGTGKVKTSTDASAYGWFVWEIERRGDDDRWCRPPREGVHVLDFPALERAPRHRPDPEPPAAAEGVSDV